LIRNDDEPVYLLRNATAALEAALFSSPLIPTDICN